MKLNVVRNAKYDVLYTKFELSFNRFQVRSRK